MKNIIIYCPNCGMKHRIKFLDNERFDVEFKCQCGEILKSFLTTKDSMLSLNVNVVRFLKVESEDDKNED